MARRRRIPRIPFERTEIETWFERDRAFVGLVDKKTDKYIMQWWDEDVYDLVEDGFLDPRDWHRSAYEYANYLGVIRE
jgi:hypothetical protein